MKAFKVDKNVPLPAKGYYSGESYPAPVRQIGDRFCGSVITKIKRQSDYIVYTLKRAKR